MKKFTFKEAKQKFDEQGRKDIKLIKSGFKGWKKESKFWDYIANKEFWSIPLNVFRCRIVHPERRVEKGKQTTLERYGVENASHYKEFQDKKKRTLKEKHNMDVFISFEEAKQKLFDKGRDDIELIEDGFKGWGKESKFLNKLTGKYFWHIPKHIYIQKEKYTCGRKITDKIDLKEAQRRFEDRTDIELVEFNGWTKKSLFLDKKINKTWSASPKHVFNRGSYHPSRQREKITETCLKLYNVEHHFQCKEIIDKRNKSNKEKYGSAHYTKTNEHRCLVSGRIITELNVHLSIWLEQQPEPKPAYTTLMRYFPNKEILLKNVEDFCQDYRENKTRLEVFTEKLLNIKHYNRKPKQLNILYKPDFKLSDIIYLNVDGLYWHSEENKDKNYHFNLRKEFEDNKLKIFQFYENEIYNNPEIVKSIINSSLNKFVHEIDANILQISIVTQQEASLFLSQNHLKGNIKAKHIGLYDNAGQLVSILSYKIIRNICKIERFCSLLNVNIVNDFSLLLKCLQDTCLGSSIIEIYSNIELRYENEEHLLNEEFVIDKDVIRYFWTDRKSVFNNKPQKEVNLYKIWCAGQRRCVKKI